MRHTRQLIPLLILLAGCSDQKRETPLQTAAAIGAQAKVLYDTVAEPAADEIARLLQKKKAGTITETETATLRTLATFGLSLDIYSKTHNEYVRALKAWQTFKHKPQQMPNLIAEAIEFARSAEEIKNLLKL